MVNLPTLNNTPNVVLWFDNLKVSPIGVIEPKTIGEGGMDRPYVDIVLNFFIKHINKYCNLALKNINDHKVLPNAINIAPIVCPSIKHLQYAIKHLDHSLYKFCEQNNVKLLIALSRETISTSQSAEIVSLVKSHIISKNYRPDILKISHLAFKDSSDLSEISDFIINIDYFNRILADVITTNFPTITFDKPFTRKYNFSILAGLIYRREYRAMFLAKCYDQGLLDDSVFLTMVLASDTDIKNIRQSFSNHICKDIINKACDNLFKNTPVDIDGNILTSKTIYDDYEEFMVPRPVLDSYINIVLETQPVTPSISEKIYKPLMSGLIFLWHGPQNILPYLESIGFKRYNYIDYSFDAHPEPDVRLDMLIKEIQRLGKKDLAALNKINQHIIEHNQNRFWKLAGNMDDLWTQLK
jgi:hypothetical protein